MFKRAPYFFIPYLVLLIIGAFVLLFFSKAATHLFFNSYHHSFFDVIFKFITWFGDGVFGVLMIAVLLVYKLRYGLITLFSFILSTGVTQFLKRFVFEETLRPGKFFENTDQLRVIPELHLYSHYSFPSGHSSGAFTIFLCLALFTEKKWLQFFFFLMAAGVAHSRLYLSQHFLVDIYFGSLFGVGAVILVYWWFERSSLSKKPWIDKSLPALLKKK